MENPYEILLHYSPGLLFALIFIWLSLLFLWFTRTVKAILFWIYLWQLKDYHIGRFLDHFNTSKGRRLFFNPLNVLKLLLLLLVIFSKNYLFVISLFILYALELSKFIGDLISGRMLRPVFTKKSIVLVLIAVLSMAILPFSILKSADMASIALPLLLVFDLFISFFVSIIVLLFQPLAVFGRNRIIARARKKRAQFPNLLVVGITGSYGKTTTKEFLAHILSKKFRVLKTKEHQNSEIGVSNCVLQELRPEHQVFVCEMGAYNRGGIKLLASIAKPSIGVLTGINQQHMATFGSQENIIKTKYELIESLPANGIAFFNSKNAYCVELYDKTKIRKVLYGQTASFPGEENLLGAMAVAKELGMTDEEILEAVRGIDASLPGAKMQKTKEGLTIIEATYSANPDGVMAALEYLKKQPGKKILVMPCLIELGASSQEVHKRIGKKIREICDLAIITTKDRFSDIIEGAGGSEKVVCIENSQEIVQRVKGAAVAGDTVFLEGRVPSSLLAYLS